MRWCLYVGVFLFVARILAAGDSVEGIYGFEGQVKVLCDDPRVILVENFVTDEECAHLIERSKPHLRRSTVVSDQMVNNSVHQLDPGRTSSGMFLERDTQDPILRGIQARIAELTHLPEKHGEGMQILRYSLGGEYRPHYDFFDRNTPGGLTCYNRGGQRLASMIIYLSDVEQGGETIFPVLGLSVKPIKRNALIFFNCTPDGKEDLRSMHGSAPTVEGEKWVAVKWLREGEFRY